MPAGYSGKTLVQKLGIELGDTVYIINAPEDYDKTLGKLPRATRLRQAGKELDFIQLFTTEKAGLERELPRLKGRLKQDGMIWISWPKRSSRIQTDLTENVVRDIGLTNGLVDVKVCAVDETWSALKFVRRVKDRRTSSIGA